jgi:predicted nucleotidyltransferase/DNA-binding XRE family transcriptional regulator
MSKDEQTAAVLLREARRRSRLSQVELAKRAGTTQSVVSAYESGARQPSLPMLRRLVAAAGLQLETRLQDASPEHGRLTGPLGRRVQQHRHELQRLAADIGVTNVRVFGSVARGEENADSDVDLLVDIEPGVGLLSLGHLRRELEDLLEAHVDLVPAKDLKQGIRRQAVADLVPL